MKLFFLIGSMLLLLTGCGTNHSALRKPFPQAFNSRSVLPADKWKTIPIGTPRSEVIASFGHAAGFDSPWDSLEYEIEPFQGHDRVIFLFFPPGGNIDPESEPVLHAIYTYKSNVDMHLGEFCFPADWSDKTLKMYLRSP